MLVGFYLLSLHPETLKSVIMATEKDIKEKWGELLQYAKEHATGEVEGCLQRVHEYER